MELQYGTAAYRRDRGDLPELPLVNMWVEEARTEPKQVCLQSRPGLIDNGVTSSVYDIVGIFQKDGVLGGDLFTVYQRSGFNITRLYRNGTLVGAITGFGHVSMAGNEIGLVICAGADVHFYDGSTLGTADFPDGADVCKVLEIAGRFVALRSGTGKFYWTEVLSNALVGGVLTFRGLAFATAENEPDQLVDAVVVDDKLYLGGKETVEVWAKAGSSELPFTPIEGVVFEKGVRATGCMVAFDNTAGYISRDNIVYRISSVPKVISDLGIEERLKGSTTASMFAWFFEGNEMVTVRGDDFSMNFNARTQTWWEAKSEGEDNWLPMCACPGPIFGGTIGRTLRFGDTHSDLDGPLERRFAAGLALDGGTLIVSNLSLRTNPGNAAITGAYTNPVVEMRYSRDGGREWSSWKPTRLGAQGEYRTLVEWRALGMFDSPGVLCEFRVTDPVDFRVSGVHVNEARGGRSR